ncbi:MAG: methyltransferase domain-containing protein [Candidatus Zhuqueibacterota bacterium]
MAERKSTREHWEKFWREKEQIEDVYSNEERIYHNIKPFTPIKNKRILEVGAGSARDSFQFAHDQAMVYVLDYSPQALAIVRKLNAQSPAKLNLIQSDAFHIPVPDNTFDIVFHQGLLEHFRDPRPLIQENFRVLKPGGLLLIDVPQRYHVYTLIKHILILLNRWFAGWETEFSIRELKNLMQQQGFAIKFCYGRWMRPSLFYRIMREAMKKLNIRLPLYPEGFPWTRRLRDYLRCKFIEKRWAFYTFLDIGVIGQKQGD